jgi:hypothetical protein
MVVGNSDKNVMSDVGTNLVMDGIKDAIIAIDARKRPFEKVPVLTAIPGNIIFGMV